MKCSKSRKNSLITFFGLRLLQAGKIKTAAEFIPIAKKLRRLNLEKLKAYVSLGTAMSEVQW